MKKVHIIGGDTETFEGKPFSLQFFSQELGIETIIFCNEKTGVRKFLEFCDTLPDGESIIYFHNLQYDLISLFYQHAPKFLLEEFDFEINSWNVKGIYAAIVFATLKREGKTIHLRDSFAYYKTSLKKLAKLFCPDLPKLEPPDGLGEKIFTAADSKFVAYSIRDAVIVERVGLELKRWHTSFEVGQTVSAPHMAAKIFKRMMRKDITLPDKKILYAALHSYHGGKNLITIQKGWYENVKLIDIISAYPWAMLQMPSFTDSNGYRKIKAINPKKPPPVNGIYKISGITDKCKWPIIYNNKFQSVSGEFSDIWITGPELVQAMNSGETDITEVYGYFYEEEKSATNPFIDYVNTFFNLKAQADKDSDKASREFYKLMLNSLYGKFIQTRGDKDNLGYYYDLDDAKIFHEKNIVAGGLFHPFIASLITGYVRAKIHALEHKYKSMHTATDGIYTQEKNILEVPGIGGLKIEADGDLLVFRNKLYILYGKQGEGIPAPDGVLFSKIFPYRIIKKFALHGFRGNVFDLEKIYSSGKVEYEYTKVNKLKESFRSGLYVNRFEKRTAKLNLPENVQLNLNIGETENGKRRKQKR